MMADALNWSPGKNGKGLVVDGEVHTWPLDPQGRPHHPEYAQLKNFTRPYYYFAIEPDGYVEDMHNGGDLSYLPRVMEADRRLHRNEEPSEENWSLNSKIADVDPLAELKAWVDSFNGTPEPHMLTPHHDTALDMVPENSRAPGEPVAIEPPGNSPKYDESGLRTALRRLLPWRRKKRAEEESTADWLRERATEIAKSEGNKAAIEWLRQWGEKSVVPAWQLMKLVQEISPKSLLENSERLPDDHLLEWDPGTFGRGIFINDKLHTWPVDRTPSDPAGGFMHGDYLKQYGVGHGANYATSRGFEIDPSGQVSGMDKDRLEDIQRIDPRLQPEEQFGLVTSTLQDPKPKPPPKRKPGLDLLDEYEQQKEDWYGSEEGELPPAKRRIQEQPWRSHPDQTSRGSSADELHLALDIPQKAKDEIREWVDAQDWPEGTELTPKDEYHVTLLYAEDGHEDHSDADWLIHSEGYDVKILAVDEFGDDDEKATVLRLESPEVEQHAKDVQDLADNRDLEVSRFPGGYKPHLTVAYGPHKPKHVRTPKLEFRTGPTSVSDPRESKQVKAWSGDWHADREYPAVPSTPSLAPGYQPDTYQCKQCLHPLPEPRFQHGKAFQTCENCMSTWQLPYSHPLAKPARPQPRVPFTARSDVELNDPVFREADRRFFLNQNLNEAARWLAQQLTPSFSPDEINQLVYSWKLRYGSTKLAMPMTLPQEQRQWKTLQMTHPDPSEVVHRWPDGWTIQRHPSVGAAKRTGVMMRNCWQGIHEDDDYQQSAWYKNWNPHSLHDEHDIPRAAFLVPGEETVRETGVPIEINGQRNGPVSAEILQRIEDWHGQELPKEWDRQWRNDQPAPIRGQMGEPERIGAWRAASEDSSAFFTKPHDELTPTLWKGEQLLPEIRKHILSTFEQVFGSQYALDNNWGDLWIIGSATSYQYNEEEGAEDLDANLVVDEEKFKQANPDYASWEWDDIRQALHALTQAQIDGTEVAPSILWQIFVRPEASGDEFLANAHKLKQGVYNIDTNTWLVKPVKLPPDFNPERKYQYWVWTAQGLVNKGKDLVELYDEDPSDHNKALCQKFYTELRLGRHRAFKGEGGQFGKGNFLWQYFVQYGDMQRLKEIVGAYLLSKMGMAADPYWLDHWMEKNGPYLYHHTSNPRGVIDSGKGLLPWDHPDNPTGTTFSTPALFPRSNHVYMMSPKGLSPGMGMLRVDLRKLDPDNLSPDEDTMLREQGRWPSMTPPPSDDNTGEYSRGQWADENNMFDPAQTAWSLEDSGTVAHYGPIPPEAIDYPAGQVQASNLTPEPDSSNAKDWSPLYTRPTQSNSPQDDISSTDIWQADPVEAEEWDGPDFRVDERWYDGADGDLLPEKQSAAPPYDPSQPMSTGLPRPIAPGPQGNPLPVPWSQKGDEWGQIDNDAMMEATQLGSCLVCGEPVQEGFVFVDPQAAESSHQPEIYETYDRRSLKRPGILDAGAMHSQCAALTAAHCPDVRQGLQSGKYVQRPYRQVI